MTYDILRPSRRLRRKKLLLKAGIVLAAAFLLLSGFIGSFYISKFRIKEISIKGTSVLDPELLRGEISNLLKEKFFKILPYDNIFILPKAKIISLLLNKFPILKEVSIKRDFKFLQKISVFIKERKPEALWCRDDSCAFIDETGFIFEPAPLFSGAIFLKFFDERKNSIGVGNNMVSSEEFEKLKSFETLLSRKNINAAKIILKEGEIYEVYLDEGWHILLNNKNEPYATFNNLELVLENTIKEKRPKLEYLDLRFGRKVFFKYK